MEPRKLYGNFKKLQDIYEKEGIFGVAFYNQIIAYIKKLLNKYLYLKQFNEDHINDCYLAIYERVSKNYDPNKGCLGTFIHTIIRNYCTKVNYRIVNTQTPISLDFEYINRDDLTKSSFDFIESEECEEEDISEDLDNIEYYCTSLQCDDTLDKVEHYCDLIKQYDNIPELSRKDVENLNKLDAVRKDLLWNIWKQQKQ